MQNSKVLTQELMGLEKKYWQAMRDKDLKTALSLTDFPCLLASSRGARSVDRAEFEKIFESDHESVRTLNFGDSPQVRMLNDDTAVVAYEVSGTYTTKESERKISAVDTSTWVKRGENWMCAMHTETETLNS